MDWHASAGWTYPLLTWIAATCVSKLGRLPKVWQIISCHGLKLGCMLLPFVMAKNVQSANRQPTSVASIETSAYAITPTKVSVKVVSVAMVTPSPSNVYISTRQRVRIRGYDLPRAVTNNKTPAKKRKKYMRCYKYGCPVTNCKKEYDHIKYHKVPNHPMELRGRLQSNHLLLINRGKHFTGKSYSEE